MICKLLNEIYLRSAARKRHAKFYKRGAVDVRIPLYSEKEYSFTPQMYACDLRYVIIVSHLLPDIPFRFRVDFL